MFKNESISEYSSNLRIFLDNQLQLAKMLLKSKNGFAGLSIIVFLILIAVLAPVIAPGFSSTYTNPAIRLLPPSWQHLFGTDGYGRDIFQRAIWATRIDMLLAFVSVTIGYSIGVTLGIISGYFGRITDNVIMRVMDVLFSFPSILLAIAIAIALNNSGSNYAGFVTVVVAVAVTSIPAFARVSRSTVLSTKEELYVLSAVSIGSSKRHIMLDHILPAALAPTVVLYSLSLGGAIFTSAALSFLGVGMPVNAAEWGSMITSGDQFIVSGQWWPTVFPGLFLTLSIMGFNMLGDALREVLDVTLRR